MSKNKLLEARRGARTHNLEIKSLTRYRLCQPGLSLLIDEVFQWYDKYKSFFTGTARPFRYLEIPDASESVVHTS
jgi:hypothetical protein